MVKKKCMLHASNGKGLTIPFSFRSSITWDDWDGWNQRPWVRGWGTACPRLIVGMVNDRRHLWWSRSLGSGSPLGFGCPNQRKKNFSGPETRITDWGMDGEWILSWFYRYWDWIHLSSSRLTNNKSNERSGMTTPCCREFSGQNQTARGCKEETEKPTVGTGIR